MLVVKRELKDFEFKVARFSEEEVALFRRIVAIYRSSFAYSRLGDDESAAIDSLLSLLD